MSVENMENPKRWLRSLERIICWVIPALLLAGCTAATPSEPAMPEVPPYDELISRFDYDPNTPLDFVEVGVTQRGDVVVHDITYASPRGGEVPAYLVIPSGEGPFPAVLFAHRSSGSRLQFQSEAVTLAEEGVIALLIDAPHVRSSTPSRTFTKDDLNQYVQCVTDLRRGIDLLATRPDVDSNRIAFVGHSYGAIVGAILSGVEPRIKSYALMAGRPRLTKRLESFPESSPSYLATMAAVDSIHYIGHAAPASLFFQCGLNDEHVTEEEALELYQAASEPKRIEWYEAGHGLNDQARLDRAEWLRAQFGSEQAP